MRFIPACAGNAAGLSHTAFHPAVHPRVRGERLHRSRAKLSATVHPRVRGERPTICTGTTEPFGSSPRARGTRLSCSAAGCPGPGSSPRARGRPVAAHIDPGCDRFIPACAGNASWQLASRVRRAVHPRVRGERSRSCLLSGFFSGSSPRARGTRRAHRVHLGRGRFIPACAGNASTPCSTGRRARFIPACAGNAGRWVYCDKPRSVHPRVRGERDRANRRDTGSAVHPRVRGERCQNPEAGSLEAVHPRVRGERGAIA